MHGSFENGILGYAGGILEQPAKYVEAMQLVDNLMAEHERELYDKAAKNAKRAKR